MVNETTGTDPKTATPAELLSIGQVAESAGVSVSALRYYDEIGLIDTEARVGGKRRFAPATIGRVNFIQRTQDAGFTLEEIHAILDDTAGGWRDLVDAKLTELTARRDRLNDVIAMLVEVRACGCRVVATCPRYPSC